MARRRSARSGWNAFLPTMPRARKRSRRRLPARPKLPALPALPTLPLPRTARKPSIGRRGARSGRWVHGRYAGPAGARAYDVYLPVGLRRRTRVPLVVLLHGCNQTATEFAHSTRFTTTADRNGFVVAVPHQESRHHPQRCWRWYESAHQHRTTGEPAVLAGVTAQVLAEDERWRIDPRRVYVTGLSAGGAMALTMAATHPDLYAAVGVHSAPAYRSASRATQAASAMAGRAHAPLPVPGAGVAMAPTIVVQGTADTVVRAPNGDQVVDQWLAYRAAATDLSDPAGIGRTRTTAGHTRDGRGYTTVRWYTKRGRKVLEHWLIQGLGHAWSGGRDGCRYSDPAGPRAATLMWQFFSNHKLDRRPG